MASVRGSAKSREPFDALFWALIDFHTRAGSCKQPHHLTSLIVLAKDHLLICTAVWTIAPDIQKKCS